MALRVSPLPARQRSSPRRARRRRRGGRRPGPVLADARPALHGLDPERFVRDLASAVHPARVREDFLGGVRSSVNGTPTFYMNGVRHDGALDAVSLLAALLAAREAA
jgi:protein-disulfide isomerase